MTPRSPSGACGIEGKQLSSRSYAPLYSQLQSLIARSARVCNPGAGTSAAEIHKWVTEAHSCLALLEDQIPSAFAVFRRILRDREFRVDEDAEHLASRSAYRPEWIDELTGRAEGADILVDFKFDRLEQAARILKLAVKKLDLGGYAPHRPNDASNRAKSASRKSEQRGDMLPAQEQAGPRSRSRNHPLAQSNSPIAAAPDRAAEGSANSQAELAAKRQAVVTPILKQRRWSRGRWVTAAGIGKNCIYEYLNGRRNPGIENRQAMADALGLKLDELPE